MRVFKLCECSVCIRKIAFQLQSLLIQRISGIGGGAKARKHSVDLIVHFVQLGCHIIMSSDVRTQGRVRSVLIDLKGAQLRLKGRPVVNASGKGCFIAVQASKRSEIVHGLCEVVTQHVAIFNKLLCCTNGSDERIMLLNLLGQCIPLLKKVFIIGRFEQICFNDSECIREVFTGVVAMFLLVISEVILSFLYSIIKRSICPVLVYVVVHGVCGVHDRLAERLRLLQKCLICCQLGLQIVAILQAIIDEKGIECGGRIKCILLQCATRQNQHFQIRLLLRQGVFVTVLINERI